MTSSETSWRRAVIDAHPDLFRMKSRGETFTPGYPTVGDGWRNLIEKAVARIAAACIGRSVKLTQIKEKYGGVRIYWSGMDIDAATEAAVEEAIALAEARSECTCEMCGEEGRLYCSGSWLVTACREHARGVPIPVRPGRENVRIVTTFEGERETIVSCRRYLRETDSFVDIDPATLGIADE